MQRATRTTTPMRIVGYAVVACLCSTSISAKPPVPEESLSLQDLIDLPDDDLAKIDIIRMNLLVARELEPDIDINSFVRVVDRMARHVRNQIEINLPFFEHQKSVFHGRKDMWISALLWQIISEDFGYGYLKGKLLDLDHTQPWQKFIHGLIQREQGTCCNLPVLYVAIAQRLGYPIRLALGPQHAYCRWEEPGREPLNFEVIFSKGVVFLSDEEIQATDINRCPDGWKPHLFRSLSPREMLGHFLSLLADVYSATQHYPQAVVALHHGLMSYPENPVMKQNLLHNVWVQKRMPRHALSDRTPWPMGTLPPAYPPVRIMISEADLRPRLSPKENH